MYRCNNCNFQTDDPQRLVLMKGCCGKKEYKCPACGNNKVTSRSGNTKSSVIRIDTRGNKRS